MSWWSDFRARWLPGAAPPLVGPPATILVAEPSVMIRKVFELTFAGPSFKCVTVEGGAEARDLLSELRPEVLFASVDLADVDGYELCSVAKKSHGENLAAAFLLVGGLRRYDRDRVAALGIDGVVVIPCKSQHIVGLAVRAINSRRA